MHKLYYTLILLHKIKLQLKIGIIFTSLTDIFTSSPLTEKSELLLHHPRLTGKSELFLHHKTYTLCCKWITPLIWTINQIYYVKYPQKQTFQTLIFQFQRSDYVNGPESHSFMSRVFVKSIIVISIYALTVVSLSVLSKRFSGNTKTFVLSVFNSTVKLGEEHFYTDEL